ncbi:prepilin-type N-terminal cleavage/methylation domain-containing protein [Candidatus Roizmanbacteria bacterium]|nr:prepilin-type N-terminal cleavage/methylation domain-containing protein [Candidatus Roizmanbacteria bacterium]
MKSHTTLRQKPHSTILLKQRGFTLIELIIYSSLLSIFLTGAVQLTWDLVGAGVKTRARQEVQYQISHAIKRLTFELRNATDVTILAPSSISLTMNNPSRNPTTIALSDGKIWIGYGSGGPCPTTAPCPLTSSSLSVTDLTAIDRSAGNSDNIQFTLAVAYANQGGRQEWSAQQTYTTSVELLSP